MFSEIFTNQYFWLSFFPISFLGIGFWLLFFERHSTNKEPIILLLMAMFAGVLSALLFLSLQKFFDWQTPIGPMSIFYYNFIFLEEFLKALFAIIAMEILSNRFASISDGVLYGFCVGLGFALMENILYLESIYELNQFSEVFWLTFQGRFWSSTILHAVTTSFFGLFYAGAYLSNSLYKKKKESPLNFLLVPMKIEALWQILSLQVFRYNFLWNKVSALFVYSSRTVILEGLYLAFLLHVIFNIAIDYSLPIISFMVALGGMFFLRSKIKQIEI